MATRPLDLSILHPTKNPQGWNPWETDNVFMWALTKKISQFVVYYPQPLVAQSPSYIKDTTDFLCKLKSVGKIPPGSLLLSLDVRSLYTNIPHQEGIYVYACRKILSTRDIQEPPTDDIINLTISILTKNNFTFNEQQFYK